MPIITVSKKGPRLMRVHLDGKRVKFSSADRALCEMSTGEHVLSWYIQGTPGESYRIELLHVDGTRFTHSDQLDSSLRDAGMKWFKVG